MSILRLLRLLSIGGCCETDRKNTLFKDTGIG